MPRTIIKCSGRRKGPNCWRCATIRSAIPSPIPGNCSNSCDEAVLMFIAEAWARPAKSGLNLAAVLFGRGSVAQVEAEKTAARVTRAIRDSSLLGGDFVSRMQVTVCKGFVTLPLRCAQCHNSNDSKSSYVLWRVVHRFFHSLRGKMFQSGCGEEVSGSKFQVKNFMSRSLPLRFW